MHLLALALFGFLVIAVRQEVELVQTRPMLVRAITAVLAAAITAGAALWLYHLANTSDSTGLAYLLTSAISAGGAIYVLGTIIGRGQIALRLRWIGWIVMTVPLIVPSTFSLVLPVVAVLAVTLRTLPPRPASTTRLASEASRH